ncbi:GtrA family protein [Lachnospiraceae bacterium OF09-6]|nr:GtrA family protein [Lachnospiraceae bacterium OF09-6]
MNIYRKYKEIINYLIVGVLTTVVSLAVYYICVITFLDPQNAIELQIANVISWIVAVTFAYITNRKFVFESKNPDMLKEASAFVGARIVTLLMDMFCMFIMVTCMGLSDKIAKLMVQVIVIVANYVFSKIFVFRKK